MKPASARPQKTEDAKAINPSIKDILPGIVPSAAFTAISDPTAANLRGFQIIGKSVCFAYAWRLSEPIRLRRMVFFRDEGNNEEQDCGNHGFHTGVWLRNR